MGDNTTRFSNRVDDYVKYRPSYPVEVLSHLVAEGVLPTNAVVADVGAGTGIFTRLLLDHGYEVHAVEPNGPMRDAMVAASGDNPLFHAVGAPAEATTLPDGLVDLVTSAQALHWFDPDRARREFVRITRAPHRLAAVWNRRDTTSTPFLRAYEALLMNHGIGYRELMEGRDTLESFMEPFFGNSDYELFVTQNPTHHDWEGLLGRLLSSSYGPKPDHPAHELVVGRLREIFDAHHVDGQVEMLYETRLYYGKITPAQQQEGEMGKLTVKIEGCRNDDGHCLVAVFDADGDFPTGGDTAVATGKSRVREGKAIVEFDGLEERRHAVVAFHDENDDGVLNMRFKVLPKEGVAFSNASAGLTGAPSFDDASFPISDETGVVIEMQYFLGA